MKNTEKYYQFKKYDIFSQSWSADKTDENSSDLLIVHGLGEHSSSYTNLTTHLADKGISCHSFDLIGHGQSSGQRGYIPSFDTYVEQFENALNQFDSKIKDNKLTIFAHSMGGLIVLKSLYKNIIPENVKIIFSNPLVGINVEVPEWKLTLAQGLSQVLPRFSMFNEIDDSDLTKDEDARINYSKDPLRHKKISVKLFLELQENTSLIKAKLKAIKNPTLFMLSTNDKICDSSATQDLSKNFINNDLELFPQSGHEIVNDLSKTKAFNIIDQYVKGQN